MIRSLAAVMAAAVAMFLMKEFLFDTVIFGPTRDDFPTFNLLRWLTGCLSDDAASVTVEQYKALCSTIDAPQRVVLGGSDYLCAVHNGGDMALYQSGTLPKRKAKRHQSIDIQRIVVLFRSVDGVLSDTAAVPLSVNFLGNYQVADDIENLIALDSYIDTLITLCISTGIAFELPVVTFFLARLGIVTHKFLKTYRRHAFLAVLVIAAMITPSTDIFTMFVTALPLQLVFELSVLVARRAERTEQNSF